MRYVWVLVVVCCMQLTVSGQGANPPAGCSLRLTQAPEIRGLRLRMNAQELRKIFQSEFSDLFADTRDRRVIELISAHAVEKGKFEGIDWIRLGFINNRVYYIFVRYYDEEHQRPFVVWKSIDQFASKLSETMNLPLAWKQPTNPTEYEKNDAPFGRRILDCEDFKMEVYSSKGASYSTLTITDELAVKELENHERQQQIQKEQEEEKKRKTFKP